MNTYETDITILAESDEEAQAMRDAIDQAVAKMLADKAFSSKAMMLVGDVSEVGSLENLKIIKRANKLYCTPKNHWLDIEGGSVVIRQDGGYSIRAWVDLMDED